MSLLERRRVMVSTLIRGTILHPSTLTLDMILILLRSPYTIPDKAP